jgi:predicted 3-demethylubiquinone-9 3-methyltransferase (glyoxalase superfamily)
MAEIKVPSKRKEENYMQKKITPFLWFDGQAEEAMNFYVSIFKNSKIVSVSRSGAEGRVTGATFQLDGQDYFVLCEL